MAINLARVLARLKSELPPLHYPIANNAALLAQIKGRSFTSVNGKAKITAEDGISHVPARVFPVASEQELFAKLGSALVARARKRNIKVSM